MKLWVDDERRAPPGWNIARNSDMALIFLQGDEHIEEMSLDHDLGGDDTTRPIVMWLCEQAMDGNNRWPDVVRVHSANPVGREWLEGMIARYKPEVEPPRCDCGLPAIEGSLCIECLPTCSHGRLDWELREGTYPHQWRLVGPWITSPQPPRG